jgi:hypothetical protein
MVGARHNLSKEQYDYLKLKSRQSEWGGTRSARQDKSRSYLSRSANKVGDCCESDASTPNLSCKICDFDKSDLHCLYYLCDSSNPISRTSHKHSWPRIWSMSEPSKIISIDSCLRKLAFHHKVWTWLAQLNGWRKLIAPWEFCIF